METLAARKYALIEKVTHLSEEELTELETSLMKFGMMKADQVDELLVPDFHQDIILERLKKHQDNSEEVLTWQQMRDHIQQR